MTPSHGDPPYRPWPPGLRYALLQVPDTIVAAGVLFAAVELGWISEWLAWLLFALWGVKNAAMYPIAVRALGARPVLGPDQLIGKIGVVTRTLDPQGTLRLAGEQWRAESRSGPIAVGEQVHVEALDGLTLLVRAVPQGET